MMPELSERTTTFSRFGKFSTFRIFCRIFVNRFLTTLLATLFRNQQHFKSHCNEDTIELIFFNVFGLKLICSLFCCKKTLIFVKLLLGSVTKNVFGFIFLFLVLSILLAFLWSNFSLLRKKSFFSTPNKPIKSSGSIRYTNKQKGKWSYPTIHLIINWLICM